MSCEASEEVTHTSSTRRTSSRPAFSKDKSINEKRHLGDELRGQRRGKRSRVSRRCVFVCVSSFALFFFACADSIRDWIGSPFPLHRVGPSRNPVEGSSHVASLVPSV